MDVVSAKSLWRVITAKMSVGGMLARYLSSLGQEREYREHGDGGESDVQFTKPLFVPPLSR